jgi:DNA-binding beta-propeller fold protein YncE
MPSSRISHGLFLAPLLVCVACGQAPAPTGTLQPRPPLEYLGEWGAPGDGPGQLSVPVSVAVDAVGLVYVSDAESLFIHKFSGQGTPLLSFTDLRFRRPSGVALDRGGAVYVADYARGAVLIFLPSGDFLREIRGAPGRALSGPTGVAVDDDGNVYVVEFEAHRVQKFSPRGRWLKAWGREGSGPGELRHPAGAAFCPDGFLYVADTHNARVAKFTRDGEYVAAWPAPHLSPDAMPDISGVACSPTGVFAADGAQQAVHAWTPDGMPRHTERLAGRIAAGANSPLAVAATPGGELLVLDAAAPRLLRFRVRF